MSSDITAFVSGISGLQPYLLVCSHLTRPGQQRLRGTRGSHALSSWTRFYYSHTLLSGYLPFHCQFSGGPNAGQDCAKTWSQPDPDRADYPTAGDSVSH